MYITSRGIFQLWDELARLRGNAEPESGPTLRSEARAKLLEFLEQVAARWDVHPVSFLQLLSLSLPFSLSPLSLSLSFCLSLSFLSLTHSLTHILFLSGEVTSIPPPHRER